MMPERRDEKPGRGHNLPGHTLEPSLSEASLSRRDRLSLPVRPGPIIPLILELWQFHSVPFLILHQEHDLGQNSKETNGETG